MSVVLISKIKLENRFDSEFYKKFFLEIELLLKSKNFIRLNESYKITDGEHGSVRMYKQGIKYLMAENIKKGYVDISKIRYIDEKTNEKNKRAEVRVGDVLLSIKGTLGEVAVVEKWLIPANMNRDVAILKKTNSNASSYLLSVFLMTKFGKFQSQRHSSGGVQEMITLGRLRKFIFPKFCQELNKRIENIYNALLLNRNTSQSLYAQAEELLLEEVGLKDFQPSTEKVAIKSFAESFGTSGRLDAEYYQPKYEEIEKIIDSYSKGFLNVSNKFKHEQTIIKREKQQYFYTEIGDINVGDGIISYRQINTEDLPANGKIKLSKNNILISKVRPYRGAVGIVYDAPDDYVGSGAFTVLSEKNDFKKETLQILLRTKPYKELMMKFNVGTSYPVIKDEDILNLPIPLIPIEKQQQIAELVEKSFALKQKSEHLLQVAKRAVEMAIEQDEAAAMALIDDQTLRKEEG